MIRRQPCAFSASLKSEFILNPTNEVLKKLYCNPKNFKSKLQTVSRTSPLSYFFFLPTKAHVHSDINVQSAPVV